MSSSLFQFNSIEPGNSSDTNMNLIRFSFPQTHPFFLTPDDHSNPEPQIYKFVEDPTFEFCTQTAEILPKPS